GRSRPYDRVIVGSDAAGRHHQYYVDELGRQRSLYVVEPDGELRVPGPDGRGTVAGPEEDSPVVVPDSDGTTRTYDRDREGRDRVRIDGGGRSRTYVYERADGELGVTGYDERGAVIERFELDEGNGRRSGSSGTQDVGEAERSSNEQGPDRTVWLLVGLAAAAAAVALGVLLWLRRSRRTPRGTTRWWAERGSRGLATEGAARGQARGRSQTVMEHSVALATGSMPDGRLPSVGRILSSALFGRRAPTPEEQRWVEMVVDEASTNHPPSSGRRRR